MSVDPAAFKSWLDAYGRAWESRDPQAAAKLFTEDGTYQVKILAVTPEIGIARWWASFVRIPPGLQTKLDGIFLISLDADCRCKSLREWWHKQQG